MLWFTGRRENGVFFISFGGEFEGTGVFVELLRPPPPSPPSLSNDFASTCLPLQCDLSQSHSLTLDEGFKSIQAPVEGFEKEMDAFLVDFQSLLSTDTPNGPKQRVLRSGIVTLATYWEQFVQEEAKVCCGIAKGRVCAPRKSFSFFLARRLRATSSPCVDARSVPYL